MSNYNLDDNEAEYFEFILNGNTYRMRYPTTDEIVGGQKIKDEVEQMNWIYGFITPVDEKAPSAKEALGNVNIKKLQRFNEMITTEFSNGQ